MEADAPGKMQWLAKADAKEIQTWANLRCLLSDGPVEFRRLCKPAALWPVRRRSRRAICWSVNCRAAVTLMIHPAPRSSPGRQEAQENQSDRTNK